MMAENIELYDERENVLTALRRNDIRAAVESCKRAMHHAHYRAKYNCAPIGPEGHVRNFEALRKLRGELALRARSESLG